MGHASRWIPSCSPPATAPTWTTSAHSSPLRALDGGGLPRHSGGISATHSGLVYLGLEFQRSFSSNTLRGVHRDAEHVIPPPAAHVRNAPAAVGL
jgi:putative flavoprotein involved in K+ transport